MASLAKQYDQISQSLPVPCPLAIAGTIAALVTLLPVFLRQVGVINHLPDPPGEAFDSNRIVTSKIAHPFGVPDALLGLGSFGATLALELMAREDSRARPILAAKIAGDTAVAAFNATRQVVSFGKLCSWCTGTAVAAFVTAIASRELLKGAAKGCGPLVRQARNYAMDELERSL